jgi:hypothetical protein
MRFGAYLFRFARKRCGTCGGATDMKLDESMLYRLSVLMAWIMQKVRRGPA